MDKLGAAIESLRKLRTEHAEKQRALEEVREEARKATPGQGDETMFGRMKENLADLRKRAKEEQQSAIEAEENLAKARAASEEATEERDAAKKILDGATAALEAAKRAVELETGGPAAPPASLDQLKSPARKAKRDCEKAAAVAKKKLAVAEDKLQDAEVRVADRWRWAETAKMRAKDRAASLEVKEEGVARGEEARKRLDAIREEVKRADITRDESCAAISAAVAVAEGVLAKAREADGGGVTRLEEELRKEIDPWSILPNDAIASIISLSTEGKLTEIARMGLVCKRWLGAVRHPMIWFTAYHDRFRPCITVTSSSVDWFRRYVTMQKAKRKHHEFKKEDVTPIENCADAECPVAWEDLPLEKEGVRRCRNCGRAVPLLEEPPVISESQPAPSTPFAVAMSKKSKGGEPAEFITYSQRSSSVMLGSVPTLFGGVGGVGFYWGQSLHHHGRVF